MNGRDPPEFVWSRSLYRARKKAREFSEGTMNRCRHGGRNPEFCITCLHAGMERLKRERAELINALKQEVRSLRARLRESEEK